MHSTRELQAHGEEFASFPLELKVLGLGFYSISSIISLDDHAICKETTKGTGMNRYEYIGKMNTPTRSFEEPK